MLEALGHGESKVLDPLSQRLLCKSQTLPSHAEGARPWRDHLSRIAYSTSGPGDLIHSSRMLKALSLGEITFLNRLSYRLLCESQTLPSHVEGIRPSRDHISEFDISLAYMPTSESPVLFTLFEVMRSVASAVQCLL